MSPTELSLREARKRWPAVNKVEHWDAFARIRRDLFSCWDILAVGGKDTVAIQATSHSNISSRIKKIAENENTPYLREAGWTLLVWGWKKVGNRWQLTERDVS